jgi:hydrogenase nickel incorporation protein HypA/HybF
VSVHEFGIAEAVLATVLRRAAGRPVRRVRLRAGIRHGIDPDSMAQAFRFVAEGTGAQGAALDLVTVPARIACRSCGRSAATCDPLARCPACGGEAVDVTGGDELVLESLTYRPDSTGQS